MTRAVFLDRDGVINEKPPEGRYVTRLEEFHLLPGVPEAIHLLNEGGFRVVVTTNQRGVAEGLLEGEVLEAIHNQMLEHLSKANAMIDAIFSCPHGKGQCDCRKPGIGLFSRAKDRFPDIDSAISFVIGDSASDVEAGRRLGSTTILITHEGDAGLVSIAPDYTAYSLLDAVQRFVLK